MNMEFVTCAGLMFESSKEDQLWMHTQSKQSPDLMAVLSPSL